MVVSLDVKFELSQILRQLPSVDGGRYTWISFAEHGESSLVDVVVYKSDCAFRLFDEVDNLHVGIEYLAIVEDSLDWWQGCSDKEIYLFGKISNLML